MPTPGATTSGLISLRSQEDGPRDVKGETCIELSTAPTEKLLKGVVARSAGRRIVEGSGTSLPAGQITTIRADCHSAIMQASVI